MHIVRVEGEARPASHSEASGGHDDRHDDAAPGRVGGGRGGSAQRGAQPPGAPAAGARGQDAPLRRWRGGPERRVALGHSVEVRPWPLLGQPPVRLEAPHSAPTQAQADAAVVVASPPPPPVSIVVTFLRWKPARCRPRASWALIVVSFLRWKPARRQPRSSRALRLGGRVQVP
jgi:hypothetical protein